MKMSLLLLLLTIPLQAENLMDDLANLALSSQGLQRGAQGAVHRGVVPKRVYEMASTQGTRLSPVSDSVLFDPAWDAPDFTNFASVSVVDGKIVRKRDMNGGTCFGISYLNAMWYSRVVRPLQQGKAPQLLKIPDFNISIFDVMFRDTSHMGQGPYDGVDYIVREIMQSKEAKNGKPYFNFQNMKASPNDYRLGEITEGKFVNAVKVAAISHHNDQHKIRKISITPTGDRLSSAIQQLRYRLESHGTQTFYFHHYKVSENWYTWDKWDWGHACLLYRVSEIKLKVGEGQETAWKLDFADPNFRYADAKKTNTAEAFSTYLLYFPRSKQITFSKTIQATYDMMQKITMIDDKEVKLGYYDVYEGHAVQNELAKENFFSGRVGRGRVLTAKEQEALRAKGAVQVERPQFRAVN